MHTILGHFGLNIDFWPHSRFSCLEHISYVTANFPQMCFVLDQCLWGHSSRDCDISCLHFKSIKTVDPWGGATLDHRSLFGKLYVGDR